ncbi:MAG: 50S ribosomal protein L30e [Candidatus Heimdallarchaeota archaeon]|nr:50S ribosomal protein L30e [Candidatus Heimdallarchaeota archaeon]
MVDLDKSISVVRKSGKTDIGMKKAIHAAKTGNAKVIIAAANAPEDAKNDIEYYCKLSGIPIISYPKTSHDLGIVVGRPHLTAFITVYNEGDSDILEAIEA